MRPKRRLGYLFGACILALTATGCNNTQIKPKLDFLYMSVSQSKDFIQGDSFFDYAEVEVRAYYTNGSKKIIPNGAIYFTLKRDEVAYNIFNPLPKAGDYTLYANYKGKSSNTYAFYVEPQTVYADHISFDGPSVVGMTKKATFTVDVTPAGYTEEITFEVADESIATLRRITEYKYEITGVTMGSTIFTFHAKHTETEWLTAYYPITIGDLYVDSLTAKGPSTIMKGTTTTVTIEADPADFTVDVSSIYSGSVVSVNKITNTEFEITALNTGEATVRFFALSSEHMAVETSITINVQNEKTELKQNYHDLRLLNERYSAMPSSGDVKMLVIPVWFTNSHSCIIDNRREMVKQDIEHAFFGDESETGLYSVTDFYNRESHGALNLDGTIAPWYMDNHDAQYYASESGKTRNLAIQAVDYYFENNEDTRSDYDLDGDGYLDAVALIYAAPNYIDYANHDPSGVGYGKNANGNYYDNIWAYKTNIGSTAQKSLETPGPNTILWASYDFMYSGATCMAHTGTHYSYGNTTAPRLLDTSTYIHETGHMFGLFDYYDYSGMSRHAGGFSTQDRGHGSHDPYSMMGLGWANPYIPTESCTITLNDFQSSRELILLTPEWNPYDSPFDEYLILELYTPTGLNYYDTQIRQAYPDEIGIRLWHVDSILYKTSGTNFTRNVFDNGVTDLAFNNTTLPSNNSLNKRGRSCAAYAKDHSYQDFSLLHMVRNDLEKDYMTTADIMRGDLFEPGDIYAFAKYKNQFIRPYRDNNLKMDFNQVLGWEFRVGQITDYGTGQYSIEVTLVKL